MQKLLAFAGNRSGVILPAYCLCTALIGVGSAAAAIVISHLVEIQFLKLAITLSVLR